MRGEVKRRFRRLRKEFKKEMVEILKNDRSLAMAIILTRISNSRRRQLNKTWYVLGTKYPGVYKDEDFRKIRFKTLCWEEDIYITLHFSGYKEISDKYKPLLPCKLALGEVYGLCLKTVNKN